MDFLRFINLGTLDRTGFARNETATPSGWDFEDLGSLVQDAHFRRDLACRPDLTPFVRDDLDRAA